MSGAFAPIVAAWLLARARARDRVDSTAELPRAVDLPSRLLHPRRKTVDFTGRDDELKDLAAWCEDAARGCG